MWNSIKCIIITKINKEKLVSHVKRIYIQNEMYNIKNKSKDLLNSVNKICNKSKLETKIRKINVR